MKFVKALEEIFNEVVMTKRTRSERKLVKKANKRAHKNTNWKNTVAKKGFKRVKLGANRYVFKRMSSEEKISRARIGKLLGKNSKRLKK